MKRFCWNSLSIAAFLICTCMHGDGTTQRVVRSEYSVSVELREEEEVLQAQRRRLKEMHFTPEEIEEELHKLMKSFSDQVMFVVTVGPGKRNKGDDVVYSGDAGKVSERLSRLLFSVQEVVAIENSCGERVRPSIANTERSFGLTNGRSIVLMFDKQELRCDVEGAQSIALVLDDLGPVKHRERFDFRI